jgi:hypothetical protein
MDQFHATTILSVRRPGHVVIGGDGQVSLGNTVLKGNARKVRRLHQDRVIAGFAGGTADAFTLFDLRVEVIATDRPMVCNHPEGYSFTLRGENLEFPPGQTFPLYPLAALLPLLPPLLLPLLLPLPRPRRSVKAPMPTLPQRLLLPRRRRRPAQLQCLSRRVPASR